MITVEALHVYPVKSLGGIALARAEVAGRGLRHDRAFMVVDEGGRFLTQRELPRMAVVATAIEGDRLVLRAAGRGELTVPLAPVDGAPRTVVVWRDTVAARSLGDGAAAWLSDLLGKRCELVHLPAGGRRVLPERAPEGAELSFADGYPLLLCSTGSREELARRGADVPMDRFRPNLVVRGAPPFAEDGWAAVRVGGVRFRLAAPCARCATVQVDQRTGMRGPEPLATLARFRTVGGEVHFGWNLLQEGPGQIAVGDPVEVEPRLAQPAGRPQ
jgi:uncharacterized protein YcbX